ncbi:MAG: aspartate kinase [Nitrospira sp.]|nr:aspartate kinase [Candidatus Manganitrophaceae bacterium]HIL33949.1 aspartate kinase [Candidatus Manganitrophaceae bacterium]
MPLIIQKYGGTSVGSIDRIKHVAERIASAHQEGNPLVVVVSAMTGETDRLINLARQIALSPDQRETDMLISSGERVTISLLAMALQEMGIPARSFTGRQVGILTDSAHTKARIEQITAGRLKDALRQGIVPVVAGFQGINQMSDVTTLGRGGSDTTAVALAAALKAELCEIYTDVEGVYTTDPSIVSSARRIPRISYEEMLEMASLGAKVLHTRSVAFAMKYQVPVRVRSSFSDGKGTLVTEEDHEMEQEPVSGITCDKNQAKITLIGVPDQPGIASKIFEALSRENMNVDMIIQNVGQAGLTDLSFTVPRSDAGQAKEILSKLAEEVGIKDIVLTERIAKVSIVGVGMRSHSGVAAKMFSRLAAEGINIMMISTSEIRISCVIHSKYTELAVRTLHEAFELGMKPGKTPEKN